MIKSKWFVIYGNTALKREQVCRLESFCNIYNSISVVTSLKLKQLMVKRHYIIKMSTMKMDENLKRLRSFHENISITFWW